MDKDTSIRVKQSTKKKLDSLPFVKKHSYNDIVLKLIEDFKKSRKKGYK